MQYRNIGNTGCKVSALGFGTMRLPLINPDDAAAIDENQAIAMLRHAIDSGINYFDTAYGYHNHMSEVLVGKALLDGYRDKVYLATKLPMWNVNCPEDFDRFLNEQLSKLQTDYIDFYLLHALDREKWEKVKEHGIIEKMHTAKAEGKVRHIGFSFHDDLEVFKTIVDEFDGCEFCQIQYNYIDVDYQAGTEGLEYAAAKGLGVIIMEPLLGGKLATPVDLVAEKLPEGKTPVQNALDFLWNRPEVSLVLSGMGNLQMVDENIAYASASKENSLTEADLAKYTAAKEVFDTLTVVPCTHCEYCIPCPAGVKIPDVFAAYNNITTGGRRKVKELFPDIEYNAGLCRKCGACESKCPQQIQIIDELRKIIDKF